MQLEVNDALDILVDREALASAKADGEDDMALFAMSNGDIVASDVPPKGATQFLCLISIEVLENGGYEDYSPE